MNDTDTTQLISLNPNAPWPHWPASEKKALSILLQEPSLLMDVSNLSPEHFHLPRHRSLFEGILIVARQGGNAANIGDMLLRHFGANSSGIECIGGQQTLNSILLHHIGPITTEGLRECVEVLNRDLARRRAIRASLRLATEAFECGDDIHRVLDAASSPITEIHETVASARAPKRCKELIMDRLNAYHDRITGMMPAMGIPTIPEIDAKLRGLHPGRVWVIGGYPEGGKSALALQIVTEVSVEGRGAGFITMEMPEEDVVDRALIMASRVDADAFTDPHGYAALQGQEKPAVGILQAIKRGTEKLAGAPLHIIRPQNRNLTTILAAIRRLVRDHGIQVVAVDYLQLVIPPREAETDESGVAAVSHAFQQIAQELNISILLLSQLNDAGDTKRGRVIEEDADAVIIIIQDRDKKSQTYKAHQHLLLVKDRHNGHGGETIPLILDRKRIRFTYGIPEAKARTASF